LEELAVIVLQPIHMFLLMELLFADAVERKAKGNKWD